MAKQRGNKISVKPRKIIFLFGCYVLTKLLLINFCPG